jgi:protein toll
VEVVTFRKMTDRGLFWCIVFFIVVGIDVLAFDCNDVHECSCSLDVGDSFSIRCDLQNDTSFNLHFYPGRSIEIQCLNSPQWSDFHVNLASIERNQVGIISFANCDLPPSTTSLGEIMKILGVVGVEELIFRSYKDLSFELTKHHLDDLDNLKRLILSNNMISYLDKDLLADLPDLIDLNLMANNIILPAGFFNHTSKLEILDLSMNNLQLIEPGMFDNLKQLKRLYMWKNNFTEFHPGIFDQLVALKSLDIHMNDLSCR